MFVVEKRRWANGDINYGITIQDARYDHRFNTAWGRLTRAAKILFGKPIYYSEVFLQGEEEYGKLVAEMTDLMNASLDDDPHDD